MVSPLRAAALAAALLLAGTDGPAEAKSARIAQIVPHHHRAPHYRVNRYGYGNYVRGPNGSFGGYAAGSDGARVLERKQRRKCLTVPERC